MDGDERRRFGGVWYPMGERVDWRDPGVYVGIKWEYCTRMRTVGRGLHEALSSALGSEGFLEGEWEYGRSVPPVYTVKMGIHRLGKTGRGNSLVVWIENREEAGDDRRFEAGVIDPAELE